MHLQVLVDPEGVERRRVEPGQKHVDDDEQVELPVFHPQGHVLVIVLEFLARGIVIGVEHFIVVVNGALEKIPAALVEAVRVLGVFFAEKPAADFLVRGVAVDHGDAQLLRGIRGHLTFKFAVVKLGRVDRGYSENRVEPREPHRRLDFVDGLPPGSGNVSDIRQRVEGVGSAAAVGLLIEMVEDVACDDFNAPRGHERPLPVDVPDLLVGDGVVLVHGLDVVDPEGQHVVIVDGVDDGVGVKLVAEGLGRREVGAPAAAGVGRENRRAGEAEQVVFFKPLDDELMHVPELAAVAFVEDDDDVCGVGRVLRVFFAEGGKLLNSRDNDFSLGVAHLTLEHGGGRVGVGRALFEPVVFLHGLVVQVLAVDDKEHLVDVGQLGREARGLERGQGFARAGRVPDVAAAGDGAVLFVVVGDFDAVQYPLGGRDLVRAHDHQDVFGRQDAVPGQDVEQGVAREERPREVEQVRDDGVARVGPVGRELEAVAGLGLFPLPRAALFDGVVPGGIGVVFRVGAIGDHENLDVLKKSGAGPEGVALVALNLVEGLADRHAPALELDVDERQAVDENCDVVAVVVFGALCLSVFVLVDDLKAVVVDVFLVDEPDVLVRTIVPGQHLDVVLLNYAGLLDDAVVGIGDGRVEEALPLGVGKGDAVEAFEAGAQVHDQVGLLMNRQVSVALFL